jgi:replicative DNA helicase
MLLTGIKFTNRKIITMSQHRKEPTRKLHNDGRIPPQAIEIEEAVLGAMLLESSCIDAVMAIVKPESFYVDKHQKTFTAIIALKKENKPVDLLTVTEQLRKTGLLDEVGGPVFITQLTARIASTRHVEDHARIVQDKFMSRELGRIASEMDTQVYEGEEAIDVISGVQSSLNNLLCDNQAENSEHISTILKRRLKEIEEAGKHNGKLIGIPTGLSKLNQVTGGWQPTDLIIIAGRPSMGKTALALYSALQSSALNYPVAFFSIEMSKGQLMDRALSVMTTLSPTSVRSGNDANWPQIETGVASLEKIPFHIDDSSTLTLTQLRASVMRLIKKHGIKLVVIDYLQLMNAKGEGYNRDQEVGFLSRGLKALAKECNIPVIALSQLNRDAEGQRPVLANLRESGNIEQDADLVIFIHRPEKFDEENTGTTNEKIELIIAKHRNGQTGFVPCYVNQHCTRFTDHTEYPMSY